MTRPSRKQRRKNDLQTARFFAVTSAPEAMSSDQIKTFRQNVLQVSQQVFADLMNVAIQTVHAWEQGSRHPSGTALRLLHMARQKPDALTVLVRPRDAIQATSEEGA